MPADASINSVGVRCLYSIWQFLRHDPIFPFTKWLMKGQLDALEFRHASYWPVWVDALPSFVPAAWTRGDRVPYKRCMAFTA